MGTQARDYPQRVFGLTFEKLLLIGLIAVLIVGPDRLPLAAAAFARFVRAVRDFANGAKSRVQEEMGSEFDEVDWKKLDPRQYDPRRIIREALLDDSTGVANVTAAGTVVPPLAPASRVVAPRDASAATPFDGEAT
jgi:sec-independent protein translocase protein TatB